MYLATRLDGYANICIREASPIFRPPLRFIPRRRLAVLFAQNLVIPDGVVAQLVDGRAKFLGGRIVNGPVPAVHDLEYEELDSGKIRILGGEASWQG